MFARPDVHVPHGTWLSPCCDPLLLGFGLQRHKQSLYTCFLDRTVPMTGKTVPFFGKLCVVLPHPGCCPFTARKVFVAMNSVSQICFLSRGQNRVAPRCLGFSQLGCMGIYSFCALLLGHSWATGTNLR